MRDATIELSVPIHVEEVDDMMMIAIGVSMPDRGHAEATDAFHASNLPRTYGPLVGMVSHPSPVLPSKVDHHHTIVHVGYLHLTEYASNAHTSYYVFIMIEPPNLYKIKYSCPRLTH